MTGFRVKKPRPLGDQFRLAREDRKWDRVYLADLLEITPGYLAHVERETPVALSDDLFVKLCKHLEIRPDDETLAMVVRQNERAYAYAKARRDRKALLAKRAA